MQAIRAQLAALLIGISLFRTSSAVSRQADGMSLVQINVLKANTSDERGGYMPLMLLQAGMNIPGVKGIKEQLNEAQNFKPPPPEPGFHKKIVKGLPLLEAECPKKLYTTKDDCDLATRIMKMLVKITDGPEPIWTWHGQVRNMMGLNFWLYSPGTSMCFPMLDRDQSGNVTLEEMSAVFGAQAVANGHQIWEFMDIDADGGFTREELHKYLRAAILIREQLPQIDMIDPKAETRKCLNMAHRVLNPPPVVMKRLSFYPKLLSIAGIVIGAVALHWLCCTKSSTPKQVQ